MMQEIIRCFEILSWVVVPCFLSIDPTGKKRPYFGKRKGIPLSWQDCVTVSNALDRFRYLRHVNGLALKTGPSSGTLVLDIDVKTNKDGRRTLAERHLSVPDDTVCSRTQSGGLQYFFAWIPDLNHYQTTGADIFGSGSGIDLRGTGGLSFIPPSRVAGGGRYNWVVNPIFTPLRPPPSWLLESLNECKSELPPVQKYLKMIIAGLSPKQKAIADDLHFSAFMAPVGQRSTECLKLITWLVKCNLDYHTVWKMVCDIPRIRDEHYFQLLYRRATDFVQSRCR